LNLPGSLDAVQSRHGDVHDQYLRGQPLDQLDSLPAIRGLGDNLDIARLFQQRPDTLAYQVMIVGNNHTNHSSSLRGT
jgi:hypothetical protein